MIATNGDDAADLVEIVGGNIGRLRARAGWSLGELARRADIGKSTLSQLEAGTGNPSVETLVAVSVALGVPFAELVTRATGSVDVLRSDEGAVIESSSGQFRARLLGASSRGVSEIYEYQLVDGTAYTAEPHPSGVRELVICLTGRLRIGPIDDEVELAPGDRAEFACDQPHRYETIDGPVTAIGVLTYR